jgi:hypothetical protein
MLYNGLLVVYLEIDHQAFDKDITALQYASGLIDVVT